MRRSGHDVHLALQVELSPHIVMNSKHSVRVATNAKVGIRAQWRTESARHHQHEQQQIVRFQVRSPIIIVYENIASTTNESPILRLAAPYRNACPTGEDEPRFISRRKNGSAP